jgi:hypothetical protein
MSFDAIIWGPHGRFSVPVDRASIKAVVLKGRIAASSSGVRLGYAAIDLDIFQVTAGGAKGAKLDDDFLIIPTDGEVNTWAEPKPGIAAGEPLGPGQLGWLG